MYFLEISYSNSLILLLWASSLDFFSGVLLWGFFGFFRGFIGVLLWHLSLGFFFVVLLWGSSMGFFFEVLL